MLKYSSKINNNWSEYDKTIANCQLSNYGIIFLDEYNYPIDNEYELEELYKEYSSK